VKVYLPPAEVGIVSHGKILIDRLAGCFCRQGLFALDPLLSIDIRIDQPGTPMVVQQKLSEALLAIVNEDDTRDKIISAGSEISPEGPQETQRLLNAELDKWGSIIKKIGFKPE